MWPSNGPRRPWWPRTAWSSARRTWDLQSPEIHISDKTKEHKRNNERTTKGTERNLFSYVFMMSSFEETFGGQSVPNRSGEAEATRVCQCHAVSPGPLVVPSNETRLISADNVSRSSARAMSEEGRFIRCREQNADGFDTILCDATSTIEIRLMIASPCFALGIFTQCHPFDSRATLAQPGFNTGQARIAWSC